MGLLISASGRAVALSVLLVCCVTQNGFGQQSWNGASSVILPPSSNGRGVSGGIRHDLPAETIATARRLSRLPVRAFVGEWSLADFVEHLNESGVPTLLDRRAVEDEGVAEDDRIRISQRLSMDANLTHALREFDLGWTVSKRGTHILITSQSEMEEHLINVTYDVTPLVSSGNYDALINTLTSTVEPNSWDEVGGPGTAQEMDVRGRRLLVVSNNYSTQQQVLKLFNSLHRFGGARAVPAVTSGARRSSLMTASQPIALPARPKKRGINLPNSGSMSGMGGGMGGGMMGGGFGGMF